MGILKTLFGGASADPKSQNASIRGQHATSGEARLRPGHALSYDPGLVKSLQDDHQALVQIYQRVDAACRALKFAECKEALRHFRSRFTDHLIVENTRSTRASLGRAHRARGEGALPALCSHGLRRLAAV